MAWVWILVSKNKAIDDTFFSFSFFRSNQKSQEKYFFAEFQISTKLDRFENNSRLFCHPGQIRFVEKNIYKLIFGQNTIQVNTYVMFSLRTVRVFSANCHEVCRNLCLEILHCIANNISIQSIKIALIVAFNSPKTLNH